MQMQLILVWFRFTHFAGGQVDIRMQDLQLKYSAVLTFGKDYT